ncbi:hypothetical protein BLOT_007109, partial [Blomia tropicalis]
CLVRLFVICPYIQVRRTLDNSRFQQPNNNTKLINLIVLLPINQSIYSDLTNKRKINENRSMPRVTIMETFWLDILSHD